MFVRIARFEGGEGNWDERISGVRERMREAVGSQDAPPISRALMLVDREGGRGASVMFCETESQLQQIDEMMNSMDMPAGGGRRVGVEMYEVAVDSEDL